MRVKTQASLPTEDAALVPLFSLVASGQIKLRKLDGFQRIAPMLNATARDRIEHEKAAVTSPIVL